MTKFKEDDVVTLRKDIDVPKGELYERLTGGRRARVKEVISDSRILIVTKGEDYYYNGEVESIYFDICERPNFKKGDIIVGCKGAPYGVTKEGYIGKVFGIRKNNTDDIYVSTPESSDGNWWVDSRYFKLKDEPPAEPPRKFKVGDKVICCNGNDGFHIGDIGRIIEIDPDDDELDICVDDTENGDWWENSKDFKLYEEPAPEYKTEHRPAKLGEYVKVLSEDGHGAKKGSILEVVRLNHAVSQNRDWVFVRGDEREELLRDDQYDVVLNYYPKPDPVLKTEHCRAKVGERVVVIEPADGSRKQSRLEVGTVVKVIGNSGGLIKVKTEHGGRDLLRFAEYDVVLDKSEPKPTYKTEHRRAKLGEYVIINSTDGHHFAIGDICKVTLANGSWIANVECVKGSRIGLTQYVGSEDYDVLIDYDPSSPSTVKNPTHKPKHKNEHQPEHKVRLKFNRERFIKSVGMEEYKKHKSKVDSTDGCEVIIIGGNGVVFNLDYGVTKVSIEWCKLF